MKYLLIFFSSCNVCVDRHSEGNRCILELSFGLPKIDFIRDCVCMCALLRTECMCVYVI
jgi:hypothetical protein